MRPTIYFVSLFVIAAFFTQCDIFRGGSDEEQRARDLEMQKMDSVIRTQQDSILEIERRLRQKQAQLESLRRTGQPKQSVMTSGSGNFHVIAGSFRNPKYAEEFSDKMAQEGYNVKIVKARNGFNLVSIGAYDSYAAALNRIKEIREGGRYQVWVYQN